MTPAELRDKQARKIAEARSHLDAITDNMSAEDVANHERQFDAFMGEAKELGQRAERHERIEAEERALETAGDHRRPGADLDTRGVQDTPQAMEYREAFHEFLRAAGNRSEMSAEARAALAANRPDLTPEQRAQVQGNAEQGGHLVPDETMRGIVQAMEAFGPMFGDDFCTVLPTDGGGSIPIPTNDDLGNEAELSGAEGQGLKDDGSKDTTFGKLTLEDHMIDTEWLRISVQLASGSYVGIQSFIEQLLGERLGRKANSLLTNGTGANQPQGIVTGAGLGKTAAAAAAITADELMDMVHSVNSAYRQSPKCRAMFNDNTLLAVSKLKDGDGKFLLQQAPDGSGVLQVGAKRIPYAINDDMADIAAGATPIVYGDFSRYYVRKIGGIIVGAMTDTRLWPNFGIAGYTRLDGALVDPRAIKRFQMAAA